MRLLLALLLLPSLAWGVVAIAPQGGRGAMPYCVNISDESIPLACTKELNITGAAATCTASPGPLKTVTCNFTGGGGGSAITLDLGNDSVLESAGIANIQTTGDTNSIFTEAPADELLIDLTKAWPTAGALNTNYVAGITCGAGTACGADGIGVTKTITTASGETDFIATGSGHLACGAGTSGQMALENSTANNLLEYCSGTPTPFLHQVPLGNGFGQALTSVALTADAANCGAGSVAAGVDASGAAQGCVDHGGLGGLTDDDHTQYFLLAGRAAGQVAKGGTAAGDDLTLQSTNNASKGDLIFDDAVQLWPNMPSGATSNLIRFDKTFSIAAADEIRGLDFSPTITHGNAGGRHSMVHWGGTMTATTNQGSLSFMHAMLNDYTTQSSTNGVSPRLPDTILEGWTATLTGAGVSATGVHPYTIVWSPTTKALNGANWTMGRYAVIYGGGAFNAQGASNSVLTSPMRSMVRDFGITTTTDNGGSVTVTDVNTIYVEDSTKPANTTHLSVIQSDLTSGTGKYLIYAPGTADAVTAGGLHLGGTSLPGTGARLIVTPIASPSADAASIKIDGGQTNGGTFNFNNAIEISGTVTENAAGFWRIIRHNATYNKTSTTTGGLVAMTVLEDAPTITLAADADVTANTYTSYIHNPTYGVSGGGTPTVVGAVDNMLTADLVAGANITISNRRGLLFNNATGSGTVTNQIALDVAALTKGSTINAGIRNASNTINTPSNAQTISAAGNTILCDATVVQISNTTGASITLTSNPTIADGQNGQECTIINVSASGAVRDVVLTNGNNLKLPGAANLTLGVNDSVTLSFNSTINDWVAIGTSNN